MKKLLTVLLAISFILGLSRPSFACVGARVMAMGGAFTGLADDINSVYWNPAGLTQLENKQITYTMTLANRDEYNYDDFIAYAQPIEDVGTIGVSFINSGYDQSPFFELVDHWFVFSYGREVGGNLSLGFNIRNRTLEINLKSFNVKDDDSALEIDLAMFWKPRDNLSAGLLIQNLNEPKLFDVKQKINVRPGIAFKPNDKLTLTFDIYDFLGETEDEGTDVSQDLRFGIEGWITEMLALRGGLYHINSKTDEAKAFTFGTGFILPEMSLSIDYCLQYWMDMTSDADVDEFTHQIGITYKW